MKPRNAFPAEFDFGWQ